MKHTVIKYNCDFCGKKLSTSMNNVEIVTSLREVNPWARLHVKIEHHHGFHNDRETEDADLCQQCAIKLLTNAVNRIEKGERLTAGVEGSDQSGWEK